MNFVTIHKGSFIMGSPFSEPYREINEWQHHVNITHDFEMLTTEVTQSMYFEVMGKNPSRFKTQKYCPLNFETKVSPITKSTVLLCPNHPVEGVSFNDAKQFIKILNSKTKMNYRLPTEAEWEYAVRAGTESAYSFGNDVSSLIYYGIYSRNSGHSTHSVGPTRNYYNRPNGNGLYDMHGNVWEWTQDWYTDFPVGGDNPTGPKTGRYRVVRGGNWFYQARVLRSAFRGSLRPASRYNRYDGVGFRLVRTL